MVSSFGEPYPEENAEEGSLRNLKKILESSGRRNRR